MRVYIYMHTVHSTYIYTVLYIYIIDYKLFYGKCGKHNNKPIWDDRYKP